MWFYIKLFMQSCAFLAAERSSQVHTTVRATPSLISFEIEMKVSSLVAEGSKAPEQMGPLNDEKVLQELKNLGNILKALHLQVMVSKRSEEWLQVGVIIDHLLFGLYILFISVSFITIIIIWVNSYNTA